MANITLEESVQPPLPTPGRVRLYVDMGGHLVQLDENGAIIDLTNSALNPGIGDAPSDGTAYVRLNATWVPESNIAPPVLSVNGGIGNVILDADDIDDATTANKFTTAADIAKLAGIQAGAEVNAVDSVNGQTGVIVITATTIGLGNVDNTSDLNKPISTATQTALNLKIGDAPSDGTPYVRLNATWVPETNTPAPVTSVNGQTGVVIIDADDIDDTSTANKFTNAADITKLAGIQAGAEVNAVDSVNGQTGVVVITATLIGLGNVDNTSDLNKPISTATQTALNLKIGDAPANGTSYVRNNNAWVPDAASAVLSVNGQTGVVVLTAANVGLGNVDNTSDLNKPISTATQTALNLKLSDAPSDGNFYGRRNAAWVAGGSSLITFVNFTAGFTLALADNGKTFVYTGTNEQTITVPNEVTVNLGAGFNVNFRQNSTGRLNFTGSNVLPSSFGGKTLKRNGKAMLSYPALVTNQWFLDGDTYVAPPSTWVAMTPQGLNSGSTTALWRETEYSPNNGRWITTANVGFASYSDNLGATWTGLPQNLSSGAVGQAARGLKVNNNGVVISLWANGFASRSTNNGTSWSGLTAGLNSGNASAQWFGITSDTDTVFVAVAQTGWASRSTDSGATWNALTKGLNSGDANANFNDIESNGVNVMMACAFTNNGCARSLDRGATWIQMTPSTTIFQQANCLTYDFLNRTWYMGANAGYILKSVDNGATWTAFLQGLGFGFTGNFLDAECDENGTVMFVGTMGFAIYTTDSGASWTQLPTYLNSGSSGAIDISAVTTDRRGNWFAVLSDGRSARSVV